MIVAADVGAPAMLAGQDASGIRVRGIVTDSLRHSGGALPEAEVLLQGSTESWLAVTRADGSFDFRGIPRGRYSVSVFHPLLDSLGITLPGVVVQLETDTSSFGISTPSAPTVVRALCGDSTGRGAAVRLRATSLPADATALEAELQWVELVVGGGVRPQRSSQRRVGPFDSRGTALLCDVPADTELDLRIVRRRTTGDTSIVQTMVRLTSAWIQTVSVDLAQNSAVMAASSGVAVTLAPVRITAAARDRYLDRMGYTRRREGRSGTYISEEEIKQRNPHSISAMFAHVNGFYVSGDVVIVARPGFAISPLRNEACGPLVLVDGVPVPTRISNFRDIVAPAEVVAIEAYQGLTNIPFELSATGRSACGLIAIWTKRGLG